MTDNNQGVAIRGATSPEFEQILSAEALAFVAELHRRFNPTRLELLQRREVFQSAIDSGTVP